MLAIDPPGRVGVFQDDAGDLESWSAIQNGIGCDGNSDVDDHRNIDLEPQIPAAQGLLARPAATCAEGVAPSGNRRQFTLRVRAAEPLADGANRDVRGGTRRKALGAQRRGTLPRSEST